MAIMVALNEVDGLIMSNSQIFEDVWNLYLTLPVEHPMRWDEFCRAIHHCQNMVLARPEIRAQAKKGQGYKRVISE